MSKLSISSGLTSKSSSMVKLNQTGSDRAFEGKQGSDRGETDSELSESDNFLVKGAFLLTPSYELSMEKASAICEKMNLKSAFSLTKTATGILFKFANPEDYQALFKKGFHKVTGARFYKKIPIPCRPQKTFTIFVFEIPEEIPEQDIRHSLYKFNSVVEVTRVQSEMSKAATAATPKIDSGVGSKPEKSNPQGQSEGSISTVAPPAVRITFASVEEANLLLQTGFDFYGATYFPVETFSQCREDARRVQLFGRQSIDGTPGSTRVQDLFPVYDAAGFQKIPPPAMKTVRPRDFPETLAESLFPVGLANVSSFQKPRQLPSSLPDPVIPMLPVTPHRVIKTATSVMMQAPLRLPQRYILGVYTPNRRTRLFGAGVHLHQIMRTRQLSSGRKLWRGVTTGGRITAVEGKVVYRRNLMASPEKIFYEDINL